jgi:hypothetical protein
MTTLSVYMCSFSIITIMKRKKKKIDRQTDRKKNKHIIDHPYIYIYVCVRGNKYT